MPHVPFYRYLCFNEVPRRKEADEVYVLGLARRASPLEHLKMKHAEFQKRMMCAAPVASPPPASRVPSATSAKRTILGTTSIASDSPLAANPVTRPSSNSSIQVFVDPSGSEAQSAEFETNAWPDLGTRKTRIKENVRETKKINGSTLKQAGKSKRLVSGSSTSKIVPYVDPSPEDMPPPAVPPSKNNMSRTPAKASFVPFVDDESSVPASATTFTPFRDTVSYMLRDEFAPILPPD